MVTLHEGKHYILNQNEIIPAAERPELSLEEGKQETLTYQIMSAHNHSNSMEHMQIKFDEMGVYDNTYVGILQTAYASGLKEFPMPAVFTNCHNCLAAVGGTINTDVHKYAESACKKFGGIFVPPHEAVIHQFGHKALTGTARFLANTVARRLDTKTRCIELSTLQRCAGHMTSRTDITEAYQVGGAAVKAAYEGHSGEMVALKRISNAPYQCTTELHPISEVANLEKKVPLEWVNEDHTQMLQAFIDYAMPLIQAELTPIYISGLTHHIYLPEA